MARNVTLSHFGVGVEERDAFHRATRTTTSLYCVGAVGGRTTTTVHRWYS